MFVSDNIIPITDWEYEKLGLGWSFFGVEMYKHCLLHISKKIKWTHDLSYTDSRASVPNIP